MLWRQVVTPNLNVTAVLGRCLEYVQNAYGLRWTGSFALDGWNKNHSNHADRDIPQGVYVPVWFDGYWTGIRYGHVVIYKDGVCYSSPWSAVSAAAGRHDTLGSIADVERIYRMTYLGWSEDMNGQRVIEENKEEEILKPSEAEIIDTFEMYLLQKPKNREQIEYYLNQDVRVLYRDVLGATKPTADEVNKKFSEFLPGTSDPNRIAYYTTRTAKQLYGDIAGSLRRQLDEARKPHGYEEVKEVLYRKNKEVI